MFELVKRVFEKTLAYDMSEVKLFEDMLYDGYKLMTIVTPTIYPYKDTVGYVYWFEYMYDLHEDERNFYDEE